MSSAFKELFKSSSKSKPTTASPRPSSSSSAVSTGQPPDASQSLSLDLVTMPITEGTSQRPDYGKKELCISYATTTLEFLKEISEASSVLAPMKAICGATLHILKTIESIDGNEDGWKKLMKTIRRHHGIFEQQMVAIEGTSNGLDTHLQASIDGYARKLQVILVAIIQNSGISEGDGPKDAKARKVVDFVKKYGTAKLESSTISDYTKQLDDSMKEFQMAISLRTSINVGHIHQTTRRIEARLFNVDPDPSTLTIPGLKPRPSIVQNFVGRQDILDAMRVTHVENHSNALQTPLITVLYGLGGSGKTQTALKSAFQLEKEYPDIRIYFLNASSDDTLKADLEALIRSTGKENTSGSYQDALTWLATTFKNWLLILDNADDPSVRLFGYIPKCSHGDVIVTTRNSNHRSLAPYSSYHLDALSVEDSTKLILAISSNEETEVNRALARQIAEELGCLPLALAQAGGYIFVNQCLSQYLDLYRKDRKELLDSEEVELPQDYHDTVTTTIKMSMNQLAPEAQDIMRLFAHLDATSIAHEIVARAANRQFKLVLQTTESDKDPRTLEHTSALMAIFCPSGEWSEVRFGKLIRQCLQYSLLRLTTQGDAKFYSMHILVQSHLQTHNDPIRQCQPEALVIRMLCSSITYEIKTHISFNRLLSSHLKLVDSSKIIEPGDLLGIGKVFYGIGNSRLSILYFEQCMEMWRVSLGEEHRNTFRTMSNLAMAHKKVGNPHKAMEIQERLLKIHQRLFPPEDRGTLSLISNLADSYDQLGRAQEALELREEALKMYQKVYGLEHPNTLTLRCNIADSYHELGRVQEASELREEVFDLYKKVIGMEHPSTLVSMKNLSTSYRAAGRIQEALKLREEVLEMRKRVLGPEHPDTLRSAHALASSCLDVGRCSEALELNRATLELQLRTLGSEHRHPLSTMRCHLRFLTRLGMEGEMLELLRVALPAHERALGVDHPETIRIKEKYKEYMELIEGSDAS